MNDPRNPLLRNRRRAWFVVGLGLLGVALRGCIPAIPNDPLEATDPAEEIGTLTFHLTIAPADVSCIRVTVDGAQRIRRLFSIMPGQTTVLVFGGVPAGVLTVSQDAFPLRCEDVTNESPATWISDEPVSATVVAGKTTEVPVTLRRTGNVRVTTDFDEGGLGLTPTAADFGTVVIGNGSGATTFTLRNSGRATTGVPLVVITGRDASNFVITSSPCAALAVGATCAIAV